MSKYTISSVFPDLNVWLALTSPDHEHFPSAWNWYMTLPEEANLIFCRFTQLGLPRLLTTKAAMGMGTLTQAQAWQAYDRWLESGGAKLADEATDLEIKFRSQTNTAQASPKAWADAYLTAFAETANLTLVTFDRAMAGKAEGAILLE
ncbi:MAG: TA system VapC family ribonuclease toxin [Terracidiphilus sp.]|jgi:toxin-antitoxin system PIN domain toxin